MRSKVIREEADRLIADHGADAYERARAAMRLARQRRNGRLEGYFSKVALEVARLEKRQVGVDTATKYLGD